MRHPHYPMKFSTLPLLSLDVFFQFLFSGELNPAIRSQVHQDMTAPLSHYYIYTSHNSYLKGNQLSSDSSDVPIVNALQRGVRVIELDMWPNSKKDDINIVHGRTLTSPVPLIKCLRSIKEYAFIASPYPVVITLEDHLTSNLQAKVAQMVTKIFGDMLYYPKSESMKEFPSPEALKRRIILSTKPPKEYLEVKSQRIKDSGSQKRKETLEEDSWAKEVTNFEVELHYDKQDRHKQDDEATDDDGEDVDDDYDHNKLPQSFPEYKNLITIKAGKPKGHLIHALRGPDKVRRLSLSEQQLEKLAASHGTDIVRFTQKKMLRIYPKGICVTSSNYNPMLGWMHGAQMVALNMQGYGRSLWLMHGFDRANGGCGYVRKPEFLMKSEQHGQVFDPKIILPVKILKVKVYLGDGWLMDFKRTYFDNYSSPDFYARVGIAGVPIDCIMKKTRSIEDKWAPIWDEEFVFPLTVPELALLRVEVRTYDMFDKDNFIGQTCLPMLELRPGIRCVPLCDRKGTQYKSARLLMGFSFFSELGDVCN